MTGVGFIILFAASLAFLPCQGQITSPPDGTRLIFLNGTTANITWSFDDEISAVVFRAWYFTSSDGSIDGKRLGRIIDDEKPRVDKDSGLSGVTIIKPATLILENVNQTYNGTYRFDLSARVGGRSEVVVFIAMKPNVTINCSDPTTINEGDEFTSVCRSEGGNPPANLTWYKDGVQIDSTSFGESILTLTNVNKQDSGRYTCKAQSYTLVDEESCEIIVHYKPTKTKINVPKKAYIGETLAISCESDGLPVPNYTITHNGTIVSNEKKYIKGNVQYNDAGTYKCTAMNVLGMNSDSSNLTVIKVTPTITVSCSSPTTLNKGDEFTCMCRSKYDNPPADVTWYKGNERIVAGKEEAILRLSNVKKEDNGTYKCEAKRHDEAKNEIIELIVNYPPEGPYFKEKAFVGESFTISCETNGHPSPNYTITHNDSLVGGNDKTYTIDVVQYSDAGLYKCIAENILGTSSKIYQLFVIANTAANKQDDGTAVVVWHIVVTLVSGIIIGIIFSYVVWCSYRRWFRIKKPERNSEPKTSEVDTTYQELDLSKMNKEDNYQSLRVNAASNDAGNDDDSTYTELNKTRDVENNYQSLT